MSDPLDRILERLERAPQHGCTWTITERHDETDSDLAFLAVIIDYGATRVTAKVYERAIRIQDAKGKACQPIVSFCEEYRRSK